jgi:hypothetical protein
VAHPQLEDQAMTRINDLIEDWIQIRSTLQRQIKALESEQVQTEEHLPESLMKETVIRLKGWVSELNKLLKEHSRS